MDGQLTQSWSKFLKDFRVLTFKKGEVILFQGEVPKYAHVVKKGIVKTYNLSTKGDEQLMYLNVTNDIFPQAWLFKQVPSALYYYEAFSDCEVYCLPRDNYLAFIIGNPTILHGELERSIRRDVGVTLRLNALLQPKASAKLVNTLHYFAHAHGTPLNVNQIKLNIILTQQDFANLTGLTRETVAIELSNLKRHGVIAYKAHNPYQINISKLNQLLADQFLAEMKLIMM
ncbi:MAG: Crp/Fnr family transcriptional regulator [Candidatus Saccharimonadales bacterium]|jgi:CRP/FNR family transcriptional regulator